MPRPKPSWDIKKAVAMRRAGASWQKIATELDRNCSTVRDYLVGHRLVKKTPVKRYNLTRRRFGKLVVLRDSGKRTTQGGSIMWLCQCDCGKKKAIWGLCLRQKITRSCGCLIGRKSKKHGLWGTPTYHSWRAMLGRVLNPDHISWPNYGGRGIGVFVGWLGTHGMERFVADMGLRPEGKTLDRINVNGHYCKENCRWATAHEQAINKRPRGKRTFDEELAADAGFGEE